MDIRERFREQKRRHGELEPSQPRQKALRDSDELLERLASRLEKVILEHGLTPALNVAEREENNPSGAKKSRPRISFDDFGGILDLLKGQKD